MAEHIVAIFDTDAAADAAARALEAADVPASSIRRYRPAGELTSSTPTGSTESAGGGFWGWLLGDESTANAHSYYPRDEERYVQGARAGEAVVNVLEDVSNMHEVVTILELHNPLEMEEETDESVARTSAADSSLSASAPSAQFSSQSAALPASTPLPTGHDISAPSRAEEVIPLAEEKIEVGKRTVDRGVTRVRRYVVERPVEQDVTLRGQRVTIERRRPIETTLGAPGQAFEERVIEVHQTEEVPVVAKTARVVEEVAIRKEETERTATVRDTVRREEVDVTDEHGQPVSRPK